MSDVVDLEHRIALLREVWLFSGLQRGRDRTDRGDGRAAIGRRRYRGHPRRRGGTRVLRRRRRRRDRVGRRRRGRAHRRRRVLRRDGAHRRRRARRHRHRDDRRCACSCSGVTSSTRCSRSRCRRSLRSCSRSSARACARSTVTPESTRPSGCSRVVPARDRGLATGATRDCTQGARTRRSRPGAIAAPAPNAPAGLGERDRSNTGEQRRWYSATITDGNYAAAPWRCRWRRARTSPERSRPPSSV